jgi:geranylgeranyl diphosphate synthase type II
MYLVAQLQQLIENELIKRTETLSKTEPNELYQPIKYSLEMGGKRLRPVLLLLAYNMFRQDVERAIPAALSIEVFHNFTLLHDDIMDKANVRRNRPTVHLKYSENHAILSGDAMAFLSYRYLLESETNETISLFQLFTQTALEVCEGQQYDMDFENRLDVSSEEYLEMIRLKTAVLLACSLKSGALLAQADSESAEILYQLGIALGLAFQLQDDLLDSFGDERTFGKKIGGDILSNKKTFLLIEALDKSDPEQHQTLMHWINKTDFREEEKIAAVKEMYRQTGVQEKTRQKIDLYFNEAATLLKQLQVDDTAKKPLKELIETILTRKH